MKNQTYSEVLEDCLIKLGEAMKAFIDAVRENWGELVEFVEQITDTYLILGDKPSWNTPKKLMRKSQVFNKKPLMARARSNC